MKIYKIEAQGDTMYVKAIDESAALKRLSEFAGDIPRSLLTITVVSKLPEGEEFL